MWVFDNEKKMIDHDLVWYGLRMLKDKEALHQPPTRQRLDRKIPVQDAEVQQILDIDRVIDAIHTKHHDEAWRLLSECAELLLQCDPGSGTKCVGTHGLHRHCTWNPTKAAATSTKSKIKEPARLRKLRAAEREGSCLAFLCMGPSHVQTCKPTSQCLEKPLPVDPRRGAQRGWATSTSHTHRRGRAGE